VGKAVYLTFDDGPIPEVTPKVLEILDKYGVKATFFMVGENIDKHPEVFEQVVKAGHAIGNHTYNHMKGWRVSTATYLDNVRQWEEAVERNYPNGYPAPVLNRFRPPYGRTWVWQRKAVKKTGYEIYLWDVLTRDYNPCRTPEAMLKQIKRETRPGSIINFHDSIKSNERMLEVLPQAIEWLLENKYEIKTL
jgi:peptidoglycan/xylan/chitin deacetylase (PgdA/CDA1 family)